MLMEKPSKLIDKKTKEYLVEAGLETPSMGFTSKVMDQIAEVELRTSTYQPLISKNGWAVMALFVVASTLLLYFAPINTWERFELNEFFSIGDVRLNWNFWEPSKTMFYWMVFVGLFLVQIPFLKRLHDKTIS